MKVLEPKLLSAEELTKLRDGIGIRSTPEERALFAHIAALQTADASRFTAAPYERFTASRMWGVFKISSETDPPVALFVDEKVAETNHDASRYVVLAVDGVSGWAWNDIDPPPPEDA